MPRVDENITSLSFTSSEAWVDLDCPHCGATQMWRMSIAQVPAFGLVTWLRCPACLKGAVRNDQKVAPAAAPFREPKGLPEVDAKIWQEARDCLGVGAYVATVMLCRKLLFHTAVANGLGAKNEKDRAPTFAAAVDHLATQGVITAKMRPWVDRIKDVGNDANHEVTPVSRQEAEDVAAFTLQLLVLAYEMDALMEDTAPTAF